MAQNNSKVSREIIKKTLYPALLFLLFIAVYILYKCKIAPFLSYEFRAEIKKYTGTLLIICIAFFLQRLAGALSEWYRANFAAKTSSHLDDDLIPLFRRGLKVLIWILALLVCLPLYGINISALIATLGVASLAIALAAQDTIANIIAGFLIMIDRPFREGDKIKLPSGEVVTVYDIGVRRSKFIAEDKGVVIMPNLELSKSKIVNYTYGERL